MGWGCSDSQFRDPLLKKCVDCQTVCQHQHVPPKCTGYCDSARCRVLPGHYYDPLVKKCLNCMTMCGRHPTVCSQHCHIPPPGVLPPPVPPPPVPPPPVLPKAVPTPAVLPPAVLPPAVPPPPTPTLQEPTVMLYSLLAVGMVLLFSSLSLALVVLMRERKVKSGQRASAGGRRRRQAKSAAPPRQEFGSSVQQGRTAKAAPMAPPCPAVRVPSDDSIPTETCVCSHCFPDLKALGHAADRGPPTDSAPFYQPPAFHGAQSQNGGPLWAGGSHLLQADAAVG